MNGNGSGEIEWQGLLVGEAEEQQEEATSTSFRDVAVSQAPAKRGRD